ncbi:MAG: HAD family hydrolase [Actinomycetota bacterium]|nr:MAG: HAD family hydrolase [Actinomycetota bacterium]
MSRLVLFDIDCTLIDAHGAGGRAIYAALQRVYGVSGGLDGYTFHGRTDPAIIRDLATRWGAAVDEVDARLEECLRVYVGVLAAEISGGRVDTLPGVAELVAALAADPGVVLGLLTGNIADGAAIKLAPTGLGDHFAIGAYGSDSGRRPDLPAVAVRRAEELTGRRFTGKEIVVIGDTPADVECGLALGVKAVAVATGRHSVADLAAYDPDHVFEDFSDWRRALAAILA